MKYRVVAGGHSQVPHALLALEDTDITICRVSGGKLKDFWHHTNFKCMRENEHDLVVLFLGGNDINESCTPVEVVNEILRVTDYLKQRNTLLQL